MVYIKKFESFQSDSILVIVDVQKSFRRFFSEMYLNELKKYCKNFKYVYQIFDNHIDGKNVDKDYLYDKDEEAQTDHHDLYEFPNQKDVIEKRYRYDVNVDFFKNLLDKDTYQTMKTKEKNKQLKRGEMFKTSKGTYLVFIGNTHNWFECPKKLLNLLNSWKGQEVTVVGGAREECLKDVVVVAEALGVVIKTNFILTYSATQCYF